MAASIEDMLAEVQRLVVQCLAVVEADRTQRVRDVERQLWKNLLALGMVLMGIFLRKQAGRWQEGLGYLSGGHAWRVTGTTTSWLGTVFGKVKFERPVGRPVGNLRGARDEPVDRALGLIGNFTPTVVLVMTRLVAQMAFEPATRVFERVHGWAPAPRSVMRMVDAMGAQVEPFWAASAGPAGDGEVIVVEVDCKGAPMISSRELAKRRKPRKCRGSEQTHRSARRQQRKERPRKRRAPGQKAKNARMGATGVIYTLKCTPNGYEGPLNKRTYVSFGGLEDLFKILAAQVVKRCGATKEILFHADGQPSIWTLQERYFPTARTLLDWYHVSEKIWEAGNLIHGEQTAEGARFANEQLLRLRAGQAYAVIAELKRQRACLPGRGPGTKWRRKRLATIIGYLATNQKRMKYLGNRRRDLPIGTGVVEGAVRHVLGTRLDNSGMRGVSRLINRRDAS